MTYCINCGQKLPEEANFCSNCGKPINNSLNNNESQRKTVFDGTIHKCPNCGDIIDPLETKCNSCGYELRSINATSSVKEFEEKFEQIKTIDKKIDLIKTFAVPNAQEDLLEFVVLAAMNIDFDAYTMGDENSDDIRLSNAWLAKLEQAHEKSQILFENTPVGFKIDSLYEKRIKNLSKFKNKYYRNRIFNFVSRLLGIVFKTLAGWSITFIAIGICFYLADDYIVSALLWYAGAFIGIFALAKAFTKKN